MSKHTPEVWTEIKYRGNESKCCLCGKHIGKGQQIMFTTEQVNEFRGDDVVHHRHIHCHKARRDMAVNALSGIASAAPGSVAKLVEAAKAVVEAYEFGGDEALHTEAVKKALAAITVEGGA